MRARIEISMIGIHKPEFYSGDDVDSTDERNGLSKIKSCAAMPFDSPNGAPTLTHGICPDCAKKLYGHYTDTKRK
jgi:hypothetical protein